MTFNWLEQQDKQINEGSYSVKNKISMVKLTSSLNNFEDFIKSLKNLVESVDTVSINDYSNLKFCVDKKEDGSVEFICNAEKNERKKLLKLFTFSFKKMISRKLVLQQVFSDIRISLHEKVWDEEETSNARKKKFRFFTSQQELNERFMYNCFDYLLFKRSNQDIIKSIPHVYPNSQELN